MFASLAAATRGANALKTSQLAMPRAVCDEVFNGAVGNSASVANLVAVTLSSDNVLENGGAVTQLAGVTGNLASGYSATLMLGIAT